MLLRKIRLFLLIFWLILAGLIVWFKVVPLGSVTYYINYPAKFKLLGGKGFIGKFTPNNRVELASDKAAEIIGDPVYFSVFTPRTFSEAQVTITYQNNLSSTTPIIEAGVLVDNILWRYKLAPVENTILENEFKNWSELSSGDILLLQKNKNFSSVEEFLNTLKNEPKSICQSGDFKSCLVLYNESSLRSSLPENYLIGAGSSFKKIEIPLQGAHQFYFIKTSGQEASFDLDFTDLNLNKDNDEIVINIYQGDNKIYSKVIKDNFGGEAEGVVRNFSESFSLPTTNSAVGLCKLEIKANDDIIIKKINKAPSALNAIGRLRPVASGQKSLSFWTDSSFILLTTNNPASRQIVNFGGNNFSLTSAYEQFEFTSNSLGLKEVRLQLDDVILENDGVFSFTPDDFLNPEFKHLDRHFVLDNYSFF